MNILVVSQYFWPENFLINDLVKILSDQGHEITVFTGKPNYPDGKIFEGYSANGFQSETFEENIEVYRVPLRPRGKSGAKSLLLNYLSFVWHGILHAHKVAIKQDYDVILVYMPSPITSVLPAIYLKWKTKTHLAVWIQDLWPESIHATGFVKNPASLWLVSILVRFVYTCADTLLVQSKAFIRPVSRYTNKDKIEYYPNSYLENDWGLEVTSVPRWLLEEISNNFSLVFAGNLGTAQSLETLVAVAERIHHLPKCKLVLVGSGSKLTWLKEQKQLKTLDNLLLPGRFEPETMPAFFERASGLLVTLRSEEIFSYTIPSKVQTYLAAGRPVIAAIDGEGARLITESGAGLASAAEDVDSLVRNIELLYNMGITEREALGEAGRKYFIDNFEMMSQSRRLVEIIQHRIDGGGK